ncbi:MAG: hypothetical protein LUG86_06835 [Oscillospiraceae bacterium]|nr:hypothetical protein [Oscillospiraceae bacterium]
MKKMKFLSVILAVAVAVSMCMTCVYAVTGSITVTVKYGDTIITDGVFTIYRVTDSRYNFTSDFEGFGFDITDLEDSTLPWLLWQWAIQTGVSGSQSLAVGSDGTVTFSGLEMGIYLVVPSTNPVGYDVEPSLVSIPSNGEYDVTLITKIETITTPTDDPGRPIPTPTTTTEPDVEIEDEDDPEERGESEDEVDLGDEDEPEAEEETLPKTGQLNYPIPIMAGAGGVCIAVGFILTKTDKKR